MSIEKTPSGRWRVRVDIGRDSLRQRKRKTKVVPTKREAQALEHRRSEMVRADAIVRLMAVLRHRSTPIIDEMILASGDGVDKLQWKGTFSEAINESLVGLRGVLDLLADK